MKIRDRLKERRLELGYTLEDVAKKVGTSKQTIQRYESGIISNIPSDKVEALAKALKTTPAQLMGWSDMLTLTYGEKDLSTVASLMINAESPLSFEEEEILKCCSKLNPDGQTKLLDYASDLVASGRYIKSDIVSKEA